MHAMRWLLIAVAAAVTGCGLDSALGLAPSGGTPALMTRVGISKEGGDTRSSFLCRTKIWRTRGPMAPC